MTSGLVTGSDLTSEGVSFQGWLSTPQYVLLEVTAGAVFRDDRGELAAARTALAWYPDEVWLWLLACQWRRIDQEEPFVGRTAEVGDDLGSRVIAGRLVRDLIRLSSAGASLRAPQQMAWGPLSRNSMRIARLGDALVQVLAAETYELREAALVTAVEALAGRHNALDSRPPLTRLYVSFTIALFVCSARVGSSTPASRV